MPKGRLSQNEKYIIEGMFDDGKSFEEISVAVERTSATVEKHIRSLATEDNEEEAAPKKGKNKVPMLRRTATGQKGVSIMTDAASSISDLKRNSQSTIKKRFKGTIHKISDD